MSHPLLMDKFNSQRDQILEQGNLFITTLDKERQTVSFKNPFDIPRHRLIQQVFTYKFLHFLGLACMLPASSSSLVWYRTDE